MPDTIEAVQDYSAYKELAELPIWQGFILQWNPKREKFDKIPNNGYGNISTSAPKRWVTLAEALALKGKPGIAGVCLNMTGGIDSGPWRLVALDFDGVADLEAFTLPFPTYMELSPSGGGVRAFCWCPAAYLAAYQDTTDLKWKGCSHVEAYIGTSERHLTVTGFPINVDCPIARLESLEPLQLERFKVKADTTAPELEAGVELDLTRYGLSPDQTRLVNGTGGIDRSNIIYGLIIKLIDAGAPQADILATIIKTPALWTYCTDHRADPDRALQFARDEIASAYADSITGRRANLLGFNRKDAPGSPVQSAPTTVQAASAFPVALYDEAPGLVRDIAEWLLHASCAPRVEFAYACALSMMSCLIGPYVTFGDDDGKVNLYIALVGGTGSGKTKAIGAACKLLSYTDAKDRVQDFPASEAALRRQLNVTPNVLLRVDELAHKIDSFKDSANGSGLSRAVLGMYDGERLPPKQYADDKKTLPAVEDPFVQILGGTTAKIWDVLQTKHLEDGTLNRFIFVSLPEQAPYSSNRRASNKIDKTFKDRLNAFFRQSNRANLIGNQHVSHAPAVQAALEALGPVIYAKQQGPFGELYGRFTLHVEKIAVILAVGDGRMVTSMTDYAQALAFMTWSVETTYTEASTKLAGSAFEKSINRVVVLLGKAGGKMRRRDLYTAVNKPPREIEELILALEIGGKVKRAEVENKNKTVTEWVYLLEPSDDDEAL